MCLWTIGLFPAYVGLLLVIGGAIYLPSAASAHRADVEVRQNGAPATGEIVEIGRASTPGGGRGGGSTTYYPVTEQEIRGVHTRTEWRHYASTESGLWVVGRQLPLLYDMGGSTRMVIDTPEASALLGRKVRSFQLGLLYGAPASVVGFGMVYTGRRMNPDAREKRARARALRSKQLRRRTP
ncbi:hypothetical protein GCM10009715_05460 [Paeniglutamicibacter psychrophenolicus]|uniref:DUF3592 domain-containing protein n=1 Tax=Paeniglutamicibacter psychrophenolicus TaxID=257454 RepID=A0ABS4WDQ7_9MICC|nr:hypothetical protein [Paeniglutamicibacter psychrophenolicus]MBP2374344.1 hypothetical protein [Paeniglutamicibacter psychrophenolicus]